MRSLKLMLLVAAIALVPLTLGVVLLDQREQAQREQDRALETEVGSAIARLRDSFAETRATVLITAHNPVFRDFYRRGGDRYETIVSEGPIMDRVNGALLYLTHLYPSSLVQASFVDGSGAENARVVRGTREAPHVLADDVSSQPFFRPALAVRPGVVYESQPHLSRDAGEWVVSYSTLVPRRAGAALVHVEHRVESLRLATVPHDPRFQIVVVDRGTGRVVLDSRKPQYTGSELGVPLDRRFADSALAGGDGVRDLGDLRIASRSLGRHAGSANDFMVVAVEPRVGAASLLGLSSLPIALALLGVVGVGAAMSRRWARTSTAAETDSLTGLGNRRKLEADVLRLVDAATPERPLAICVYDLDGFKSYNDTFGHPAGDVLLARLGARLQAVVGERGYTYRLGGDEFCVVADADEVSVRELEAVTSAALAEHGDGFAVTTACGRVLAPLEGNDHRELLRLADQRLYAAKRNSRFGVGRQAADVLLRALQERHPDLHTHLRDVAELAGEVAVRLGMGSVEVDCVRQAGALHDLGKMAIPDAILSKPGTLDPEEWTFVQQHPLIGERILAAAPALAEVARLVRSSHERWDGLGYPDTLARDEIPLGARIIAVCDAFEAMSTKRPYRFPVSEQRALAELRRCAGTQFDPGVVEAFCAVLAERGIALVA
ncbi:MAG: diguanylate cyclase [Gaiellaceae bacterium MAG52_C11]|nr:diguanylate cyclase [Candidatus Gaiellasilicea maunaloa]